MSMIGFQLKYILKLEKKLTLLSQGNIFVPVCVYEKKRIMKPKTPDDKLPHTVVKPGC